jgi:putative ABC transport system permease protein
MILYPIKQAIRQITAQKLTAAIQVIGLGIGLGSVIVMMSFIIHEYSFDKYHVNGRDIYRVVNEKDCSTPYIMGTLFSEEIPEIKKVFRIYDPGTTQFRKGNDYLEEHNVLLVDSCIFSVLNIPLISGAHASLYRNPGDIVISDKASLKYFGNNDPIGQPIEIILSGNKVVCQISGIFKHFPSNSSIQADFLGNIYLADYAIANQSLVFSNSSDSGKSATLTNWQQRGFQTFLLLAKNPNLTALEQKATHICKVHDPEFKDKIVHLQPMQDIYFHSEDFWNSLPLAASNIKTIRLFEGIAVLILLVAWFNYFLLSTAETRSQMKGIACRKVIGASANQISCDAYLHSFIIVLISLLPALLFTSLAIPVFNQLFDKNIDFALLQHPVYLYTIAAIALITGLAGGTYVSVFSSRLPLTDLFKPRLTLRSGGIFSSSGIIITLQFIVFFLLTSAAILIHKQVQYSEHKDQGFNNKQVMVFMLTHSELRNKIDLIKTKLAVNPHVVAIATSGFTPPTESFIEIAIGNENNEAPIKEEALFIGADLIELLQIPVIDGSTFQENRDYSDEMIINESASKKYHVKAGDLLGSFKVRGVLKDFHVHSVHRAIKPLFLLKMNDNQCLELTVRSDSHNREVIQTVRDTWSEIMPTALLRYETLEDRIADFYAKEKKQMLTISFFSLLVIFLSVIGLFGFVSLSLMKRIKEIGVRRVNGARLDEIIVMLNKDFIRWVIMSCIIACPIAWFALRQWLQQFAYKTSMSWWVFALAGVIAITVAMITVSCQCWRAATRNPVEALRSE